MPRKLPIKAENVGGIEVYRSSGNVFADIGLPNPEQHLFKANLVLSIERIIKCRRLGNARAARLLGMEPSDLLQMRQGYFRGFSVDRLLRLILSLGHDVEIAIKPAPPGRKARMFVAGMG